MIRSKDMGCSNRLMELFTRESLEKMRRSDEGSMYTRIRPTKVSSRVENSTEKEC